MDFSAARRHMIDSQILPNRVTDERIIAAMEDTPREVFLPKRRHGIAYADEALNVADGRFMMEPMIIGRLLQAARAEPEDVALVIGSGAGYVAALLAKLCSTVVGVESDESLIKASEQSFDDQGLDTIAVMEGALVAGYADQAPYDVIFVNGAVTEVPIGLQDQLADGGRLVAIEARPASTLGRAILIVRDHGVCSKRELFDAGTPELPGFRPEPVFSF